MPQKGEQQDSLPRGFWPRLGLGASMLFIFVVSAGGFYYWVAGAWEEPGKSKSFLDSIGGMISSELIFALMIYSGLSMVWAIATPKWAGRLLDKAERHAFMMIFAMVLLSFVYSWLVPHHADAPRRARAMSPVLILFMALGTAVVGVFLWAVIATTLRQRRLSKLPPPPPFRCPACNSDQVNLISSGLWDAIDLQTDKRSSGCDDYGICKQCGSRCARARTEPSYVPSEDEWQGRIGPILKGSTR